MFFFFLAGILAAVVGLGGAIIYTPMLIELGVHPKVTSSTALYLVMYTSLSNTI